MLLLDPLYTSSDELSEKKISSLIIYSKLIQTSWEHQIVVIVEIYIHVTIWFISRNVLLFFLQNINGFYENFYI